MYWNSDEATLTDKRDNRAEAGVGKLNTATYCCYYVSPPQ